MSTTFDICVNMLSYSVWDSSCWPYEFQFRTFIRLRHDAVN